MSLPIKIYNSAEKLTSKQLLLATLLIATIGVGAGVIGGNLINRNKPSSTPLAADNGSIITPSYSGKIFPIDSTLNTSDYTHKLVDDRGNTTAYLVASDDKLKIVLTGTEVSVIGKVTKTENGIPVVMVNSLSF